LKLKINKKKKNFGISENRKITNEQNEQSEWNTFLKITAAIEGCTVLGNKVEFISVKRP
jgi:hypothetical protein